MTLVFILIVCVLAASCEQIGQKYASKENVILSQEPIQMMDGRYVPDKKQAFILEPQQSNKADSQPLSTKYPHDQYSASGQKFGPEVHLMPKEDVKPYRPEKPSMPKEYVKPYRPKKPSMPKEYVKPYRPEKPSMPKEYVKPYYFEGPMMPQEFVKPQIYDWITGNYLEQPSVFYENDEKELEDIKEQIRCISGGGKWSNIGLDFGNVCVHDFEDRLQVCTSSNQCQGNCLVFSQESSGRDGLCQPDDNPLGCFSTIEDYNRDGIITCLY